MNPERHALEVELFEAACELPPAERAAFLDERCGDDVELRRRLGVLFEADSMPLTQLEEPALDLRGLAGVESGPPVGTLPESIADFDIVRELGRGGMGIVYEAEQRQPRRRVALKVVRSHWLTASTLRRFEHEAEVLGWLNHPGIAQVYEAGTWNDGERDVPYFAMELVRGTPLVRWAEQHELAPRERLAAFALVCEAVHHAHTKGVIHRDLKPSNILVDEHGQPKVLDFGVARVVQSELSMETMHTRSGELVGTLKYMSPEQVASDPSDLDTRSDVYALGVVAYELLIGRAPYDLAGKVVHEAALVILEKEPSTLGAFDARLRGDVETIIQKAVAKERERRYASAQELANDVRRYLADEPIVARPPSPLYLLRKFARRNRALCSSVAAVFVALLVGLVVALVLYRRAESARIEAVQATARAEEAEAEARNEARTADRVAAFLVELFERADSTRRGGEELTAVGLLDGGAEAIARSLANEPRLRGRLLRVMGRAYHGLGRNERALELLEEGIALGREHDDRGARLASDLSLFGRLLQFEGRHERAGIVLAEAIELHARAAERAGRAGPGGREGAGRPAAVGEARARIDYAAHLADLGRLVEAEAIQREGLARIEAQLDPRHPDLVFPLRELAATLHLCGRHEEATRLQERALGIVRDARPDRPTELVLALSDLGWGYLNELRAGDAAVLFEEALALAEATFDDDHPTLALARYGLASALCDLERYAEAEELFERSLAAWLARGGETHHGTVSALDGYARLLQRTGRLDEAQELRERIARADRERLGPSHPRHAINATLDAELLAARGDHAGALAGLERALAATTETWGDASVQRAQALVRVADALAALGLDDDARARWTEAVELFRDLAPDDPARAYPLQRLAWSLVDDERFELAEERLLEAWRLVEARWSDAELVEPRADLARFYERWGRPDEARRYVVDGSR